MSNRLKTVILLLVLGVVILPGCMTVPITGRSQFIATSEADEISQGEQAWRKMCASGAISSDPVLNNALRRVGKNIAAVSGRPDYHWEFRLFIADAPNAFCLPGGKVGATTALFKYTANDAELATVIGHEVGHAIARHSGERMSQGLATQVGRLVLDETAGREWAPAYNALAELGFMLPYSRLQEYEADHIGIILMARAGYNPAAALRFWKKFSKISQNPDWTEFLATHPIGKKRLKQLGKFYPEARKIYLHAKVKRGYGKIIPASRNDKLR